MIRSHLRAVFSLHRPHTWEERDANNRPVYRGQTMSQFLNITQSLNITLDMRLHTGSWGYRFLNGTYSGMQRIVKDDEADVAIGPFYSSPLTALELHEGKPHVKSTFVIVSGYRQLFVTDLARPPFDSQVSLVLILACLLVAFTLYVAQRRLPKPMTAWDALYLSQSIFLQDPVDNRLFVDAPSQITVATWSFASLIIAQVVAGILRSTTMVRTPVHRIGTFQEIIDRPNMRPLFFKDGGAIPALLELRGEKLLKIMERVRLMQSELPPDELLTTSTANEILDGNAVLVIDTVSLAAFFPVFCGRAKGAFHMSDEDGAVSMGVWVYSPKLDAATREAIDLRTVWVSEMGVPWLRERDLSPVPPSCFTFALQTSAVGDTDTFSLETLFPFIVIWLVGCGLSCAVFLIELITYHVSLAGFS